MTLSFRSSGEHTWTRHTSVPFLLIHLSLPLVDSAPTTTVLRFMSLETGGAHPLAKLPDLRLDTHLPVNLLDVRADVIGDQIVLVLVDLRTEAPESDAIYLVDWKQGLMTLVRLDVGASPRAILTRLPVGPPRTQRDVRGRALGALSGARALPQARDALN
jgi:hypothetical protein